MITQIEDYFTLGCGRCDRHATPDCSTRRWDAGLRDLRRICVEQGLVETVKWGHPCYMHAGRNIAIFGAMRGDFRLTFFNAALLKEPGGVLERQGPNTRHPDMLRFTDVTQVMQLAPTIRAYLTEAMGYAEAGLKPPKDPTDLDLPDDLIEAMDPDLAEAFDALTPGRQKSYVIAIGSAKAQATRMARLAKYRPHILAGKGALER
ncbi:MAG: YdeI/OmpD-associated family protein [Paracoccaceae bacterium]